jgi:transposase-like protein
MEQGTPTPKALLEAVRYFSDPDTCQDFFVRLRWPNGVTCPTCGSDAVTYLPAYRRWSCRTKHPKRQFSAKVGTIFEDSPLSLEKWLPAVWLIASAKNGISSYEIARALSITQKSAWFMLHRIRLAMETGTFEKMQGRVEVDETFIGGAARFMHRGKKEARRIGARAIGKTAVMGLLERHGPDKTSRVRAFVVPTTRRAMLDPKVRENVGPGSEILTDALPSYDHLRDQYAHNVIDHAESYVRGHVHTGWKTSGPC